MYKNGLWNDPSPLPLLCYHHIFPFLFNWNNMTVLLFDKACYKKPWQYNRLKGFYYFENICTNSTTAIMRSSYENLHTCRLISCELLFHINISDISEKHKWYQDKRVSMIMFLVMGTKTTNYAEQEVHWKLTECRLKSFKAARHYCLYAPQSKTLTANGIKRYISQTGQYTRLYNYK